jgi:hypothetical protein
MSFMITLAVSASAVTPAITSFNTGQTGALMEGNTAFPKYSSSSRTIENMMVAAQGPVFRRPGTKYIATQKDSSAVGRVAGFEHSVDDSYVLLFEDQALRFFRNGGQILDSAGTEDISGLDNIVAHWLLNEVDGTVVADDDGGTHNGTASANINLMAATGKVGSGSFDLDDQYTVEVSDHDDFSFTDDSDDSPFSIACWVNVEQKNDTQAILSKWKDNGATREWRLSLDNNRKLQMHLADTTGGLDATIVAQWKLNETGASPTLDNAEGTAALDATASQNADSAGFSQTGVIGTCFDWDATHYATVTDNAALSFGNGSVDSPMSISAWIYVTNTANRQQILSKLNTGGGEWYFYLDSSERLVFGVIDASVNLGVWWRTKWNLGGGWRHVAISYEGYSGSGKPEDFMTLYVDGVAVTQELELSQAGYVAMENTSVNVLIGAYHIAGVESQMFADKIDNVILFSTVLSSADVASLYNLGNGNEEFGATEISSVSDDSISFGWHYLASTYSAPADESTAASGITLYVDGVAVDSTATNSSSYTAMQNGAEEVRIGSHRNSGDSANEKFLIDKIDEISVYSDVLTPTEVASLYSANTPYEISTPYLTEDLFDLSFKKSEEVMFIAHPDYEPRQLTRTGHTNWTLTALGIDDGPFQAENTDTSITITPSAISGSIVLVASDELFVSGHVGSIWQINQQRDSSVYQGALSANGSGTETAFFVGSYSFITTGTWSGTVTLERSTDDGSTWNAALTALTDINFDNPAETEEDGAIYRVTMSGYSSGTCNYTLTITDQFNHGIVRITGVSDGKNATANVLTDLVNTDATSRWREGYWSDYRGWPEAVTIHQQRLIFGGSASFPQTIWFGKTDPDEYTNFTEGTLDTSAFTIALAGQNPIRWLLSQDFLLIGTSGSCGKYGEQGAPITPTSPSYQEQTTHGSADIRGMVAGDTVLYVERGARKVREFSFNLQFDKYLSPNLTVLSPEITESGIKDVAFQMRPDPILWCVLNDGEIATLTYEREQAVAAWTKQVTDGNFESVAIIPGTNEDEVWVSVKRVIDSNDARYVEQFQPVDWGSDVNDAWFLDSALSYTGTAETDFNGLDHLVGENVFIYADTIIAPNEVVDANGAITTDRAFERVLAGVPYTSKLETMPLAIDPQDKPMYKRIRNIAFDLYETGYCQYGNGANSTLTNINFKNDMNADPNATAQGLYTSQTRFRNCTWPYGSMKKQTIYVESQMPMPLTIRSIIPDYEISP